MKRGRKINTDIQSPASWNPFKGLSDEQRALLEKYQRLLVRFNQKINLISREDEMHARRHIRHALALAWRRFPPGSTVVDWGTGGGLPALPLAIYFPDVEVHAVDAAHKKVQAVRAMARRLGLENVHAWHGRAEDWPGRAQYSVSRATAPLAKLWRWHVRIYEPPKRTPKEDCWRPGLLVLKGGDLREEIAALRAADPEVVIEHRPLQPLLGEVFFAEKCLVAVR